MHEIPGRLSPISAIALRGGVSGDAVTGAQRAGPPADADAPDDGSAQTTASTMPMHVFFRCPSCTHQVDGTRAAFDLVNLSGRTWCNRCRRNRFVKLWLCRCGHQWYTCSTHGTEPTRLRQLHHRGATPARGRGRATTNTPPPLAGAEPTRQWLDRPGRTVAPPAEIVFTQQEVKVARSACIKMGVPHRCGPEA